MDTKEVEVLNKKQSKKIEMILMYYWEVISN
jgi:hypothetical protein